ncbi:MULTISPECIES: rod shape-determining protein RodA [Myroides]|uniref:Cell wall polymerase n=1 Tax=Myroides albus TaxID=2562892 RepID=A0A6I3LHN7_9FLAO|nr:MULTISPECIES: rod shape-determining protein RodA [Myroides]MTG97096.1 rod shape-determining protein RodA [Myroides albus]MVX36815.1 rod shape-determining protein RodA [Myroides sp. LoEW2-1]UVD78481.1 rod shape-determining protein RodA [Myroides albus]
MRSVSVQKNIDWLTVLLYFLLVIAGWFTIYSASLPAEPTSMFDLNQIYGRQLIFIILTFPIIILILSIDAKFYEKYALIFYIIGLLSIIGLFFFGKSVKGQTNWYSIAGFGIQPSEFVKTTTALLLAKYLSDNQGHLNTFKEQLVALTIIAIPTLLILKHDTGSAMLFASLIFVLYREGLPSWYLWTGFITVVLFIAALVVKPAIIIATIIIIASLHFYFNKSINRNPFIYIILAIFTSGFVFSVDYVYDNVLEPHQKDRINVLLGENVNLQAEGYNLNQSKIAIGSGNWTGTGFLEGTQTKGGFVPEQHTDYIFTTVGEEWGFAGASVVIVLFVFLFFRLIYLAENQKKRFNRVYGYCVVSFLFIHFAFNITMLIGLFPTIGVPLPFFSYGGSSLIAFTLLLFIFLKLDANKINEW